MDLILGCHGLKLRVRLRLHYLPSAGSEEVYCLFLGRGGCYKPFETKIGRETLHLDCIKKNAGSFGEEDLQDST
jgi:hypothetical protein